MSERDQTLVSVTLDKQRAYRVQDSDRDAVWVGPGPAEVPRWVAEHWGLYEGKAKPSEASPTEAVNADGDVESGLKSSGSTPLPSGTVSATVETVEAQPLKTTETVQTVTGGDLDGLGLTGEQKDALIAAGYGDRAALTAAVEAAGDSGLAGLSRATVRSLRKALSMPAVPADKNEAGTDG